MTKEEAKKILACRGNGYSEEDFNDAIEVAFNCIPPISSDIDKAAEEYANYNSQRWHEDGDIYYDYSKIVDAFKAGVEWRDTQIPKLPNSIDEAAEKYAIQGHENHTNVNYINTYIEGKRIGFKAGAEWMIQQGERQSPK